MEEERLHGLLKKAESNADHKTCCENGVPQCDPISVKDTENELLATRSKDSTTAPKETHEYVVKWDYKKSHADGEPEEDWREHARDTILCAIGLAGGLITGWVGGLPEVSIGFYAFAILAGGRDPAIDALEKIREGVLDIHFLMLAVALGAACVGAWWEGALLLFLFSLSGTLEHFAEERTHREIRSLFKSAPKNATFLNANGQEETIAVEQLKVNDVILVKPGELFPVDARMTEGKTEADESTLTGEAAPVLKQTGDLVYGGTINLWGSVRTTVIRRSDDSSIQKIIRLVEEARHTKAKAQSFTDKFGTGYTWLVLGMTTLAFLCWWLVLGIHPFENTPEHGFSAFYRAMTLLVVASPCALVLSIPSAILASIASGAKQGILFKGGAAIEKLSEIHVVCLDKTGTLTTGELEVIKVESYPANREDRILKVAIALEQHSAHPLARAITRYGVHENVAVQSVENFQSHDGLGVSGTVGGLECKLGRRDWLLDTCACRVVKSEQIPFPELGFTEVWVCVGETYGRLLLKDRIRQESAPVIAQLKQWNLQPMMLTGDREESAHSVADIIGLEHKYIHAGLKPDGKVALIREQEKLGKKVAMVGDGVNDAPCLAAAYVSVGMGARGSGAALEESEVILMEDKIEKFLDAYYLSKTARSVIQQNLIVSLGTIILMVFVALGGWIPLTVGVIAHEGSTVIVCLNSLRLLFTRRKT